MKFPDAPKFIKFALGENVKQSNWGIILIVFRSLEGVEQAYDFGLPEFRIRKKKKKKPAIKITEKTFSV